MAEHEISLDVVKREMGVPPRVVVRMGDVGTQTILAHVTNLGEAYAPSQPSARLDIMHQDGTWARCSASVDGSDVTCTLPPEALSSSGRCRLAHFVFFDGTDEAESTEGFELVILPNVDASNATKEADNYDDLLTKLWEKWSEYEAQAEASERGRVAAEQGRVAAEQVRVDAESARVAQEQSRAEAEAARVEQFGVMQGAVDKAVETADQLSEDVERFEASEAERAAAEEARQSAEAARAEAESARDAAEGARADAEALRESAEEARASAEQARAEAESSRASTEAERAAAEQGRATAEGERVSAESARETAEQARETAEQARAGAEGSRAEAEADRAAAETARAEAETARASSQTANDAAQAKNNADQAANNAAAAGITFVVLSDGQYDPDTLEPSVAGENGKMYLVPDPEGEEDNLYAEWIWVPSASSWEHVGSTAVRLDPITTEDVDAVAGGQSPTGERVLNVTGLSYLWTKLDDAFAAALVTTDDVLTAADTDVTTAKAVKDYLVARTATAAEAKAIIGL